MCSLYVPTASKYVQLVYVTSISENFFKVTKTYLIDPKNYPLYIYTA